jgi:hypothetical protein
MSYSYFTMAGNGFNSGLLYHRFLTILSSVVAYANAIPPKITVA